MLCSSYVKPFNTIEFYSTEKSLVIRNFVSENNKAYQQLEENLNGNMIISLYQNLEENNDQIVSDLLCKICLKII